MGGGGGHVGFVVVEGAGCEAAVFDALFGVIEGGFGVFEVLFRLGQGVDGVGGVDVGVFNAHGGGGDFGFFSMSDVGGFVLATEGDLVGFEVGIAFDGDVGGQQADGLVAVGDQVAPDVEFALLQGGLDRGGSYVAAFLFFAVAVLTDASRDDNITAGI